MKTPAEMTYEELVTLVRGIVREELHLPPPIAPEIRSAPLNFPVIDVGPWPEDLKLAREEFYED